MSTYTVGIDEVGRGCLWGPVCVGGVCRHVEFNCKVRDSKKMSEKAREKVAPLIQQSTLWNIAMLDPKAIEIWNIEQCMRWMNMQVLEAVVAQIATHDPAAQVEAIFDGNGVKRQTQTISGLKVDIRSIPKADDSVFEVSAASVIAKVHRDQWVVEYARQHPEVDAYDIAQNKGYGTPAHIDALLEHDLHELHRKKFCRSAINKRYRKQGSVHVPSEPAAAANQNAA